MTALPQIVCNGYTFNPKAPPSEVSYEVTYSKKTRTIDCLFKREGNIEAYWANIGKVAQINLHQNLEDAESCFQVANRVIGFLQCKPDIAFNPADYVLV